MEEAKSIIEAPSESARRVAICRAGERDIARHLLQSLVEQGFSVGGDDGEEQTDYTDNWKDLHSKLFETDVYDLYFMKVDAGPEYWVKLVYGNSPEEMICNYDVSAEPFLKPTFLYIKSFYDPSYIINED